MTSSTYGNYLLHSQSNTIAASISNEPTTISFYWNNNLKGGLAGVAGPYSGTFTPSLSDFIPGIFSPGASTDPTIPPAKIKVSASNLSGSASSEVNGYVTSFTMSQYRGVDPAFAWYDEQNNLLYGRATGRGPAPHGTYGTYNCLAYSVGIVTRWQWPNTWDSYSLNNIPLSVMLKYMNGTDDGNGSQRTIGSFYSNGNTTWSAFNTKVIYYDNGHFSKVISYNSDGSPKEIMSKWGAYEVVKSYKYNPFTSVYGNPMYYFY